MSSNPPPAISNAIQYAGYVALRITIATIQALPLAVCERVASGMAWLLHDVLRIRRRVVENNLRIAFPDWPDAQRSRVARRMWRHLFLMIAEIAHTPRKVHRTTWRNWIELEDDRVILDTVLSEGPKIVISAHYGNFELGGYLLGLFGLPTHTIARTLDNRYVDRFVNEFRGRTGQYILPKNGSSEEVDRVLSAGGVLTLLGDQFAGYRGCWVDFFGKPASTHKAVSLFSLSYEAPTVVVGVQRLGDSAMKYRIWGVDSIRPADDDFELGTTTLLTEWFTRRLEKVIRREPSQYWWVHRRWKGEPPKRRKRKKTQAAEMSDSNHA